MKALVLFLLLTLPTVALAQKKGLIVNMTDGVPIRDVKIYTNTNTVTTTNWKGEFTIDKYFTSITITHPNYLSLTLNLYEMTDTIELIPNYHTLDEVVIYGKRPMTFDVKKATRDARDFYTPNVGGFTFDFFNLFKSKGLNDKEREKHDQIIKTY